ncbi:MAG: hypothetical protein ABI408_02880, partial [Gemmatimonadaceae bacterium]
MIALEIGLERDITRFTTGVVSAGIRVGGRPAAGLGECGRTCGVGAGGAVSLGAGPALAIGAGAES